MLLWYNLAGRHAGRATTPLRSLARSDNNVAAACACCNNLGNKRVCTRLSPHRHVPVHPRIGRPRRAKGLKVRSAGFWGPSGLDEGFNRNARSNKHVRRQRQRQRRQRRPRRHTYSEGLPSSVWFRFAHLDFFRLSKSVCCVCAVAPTVAPLHHAHRRFIPCMYHPRHAIITPSPAYSVALVSFAIK